MTSKIQFNDEMNAVVSILRALIISRKECGVADLLRDFYDTEGKEIPFRQFGFRSLEDFLQQSDEFKVTVEKNESRIYAKTSVDSMHINRMVAQQNSSKKPFSKIQAQRKLQLGSHSNQPHRSAYSNVFAQMPDLSPTKHILRTNKTQNNNGFKQNRNLVDHRSSDHYNGKQSFIFDALEASKLSRTIDNSHQQQYRAITKQPNESASSLQNRLNNIDSTKDDIEAKNRLQKQLRYEEIQDLRKKLRINNNEIFANSAAAATQSQKQSNDLRLKLNQKKEQPQHQPPPLQQNSVPNIHNFYEVSSPSDDNRIRKPIQFAQSTSVDDSRSKLQNRLKQPQHQPQISPPIVKDAASPPQFVPPEGNNISKLNNRLIKLQIGNHTNGIADNGGSRLAAFSTPPSRQISVDSNIIDLTKSDEQLSLDTDVIYKLERYCQDNRFDPPEYKFIRMKKSSKVQCCVLVNKKKYSTYPEEYSTEAIAKCETAKSIWEKLLTMENIEKYPVTMDTNSEIIFKIYECIKSYAGGIFCKNVNEVFRETYKKSLPDDWYQLIAATPQMFSIEIGIQDHIINVNNLQPPQTTATATTSPIPRPLSTSSSTSSVHSGSSSSLISLENDFTTMEKIQLPWHEKYWNLYIKNPVTTVEIWGRLIGPEYSDKMDFLITDIELALLTEKKRPSTFQIGHIYLVVMSECAHRVRVDRIDLAAVRCLCFYIDIGDEEWLDMDQMYSCDSRFLKFPAQAVCFSLFGLEDFAENPYARPNLDTHLRDKTLIGEIITKHEDFTIQEESVDMTARIQIALYDTSSDDDVNLNPIILEKICEDTQPPQLQTKGITNVIVTYVSDGGDVFCQVRNNAVHYLKRLIHQLTKFGLNNDQHRIAVPDRRSSLDLIKSKHLYLVFDKNDNEWYRASIVTVGELTFKMFFVDYGMQRDIEVGQIYRLDSLSVALDKYPYQAIQTRLLGLEQFNEKILASLRFYLNRDTPAIIKLMDKNSVCPQVNVFIRFQQYGPLCCINEAIRLDQEIDSSDEVILPLPTAVHNEFNSSLDGNNHHRSFVGTDSDASGGSYSLHRQLSSSSSTKSLSDTGKLHQFALPKIGDNFQVHVTMASNPSNFIVRSHLHLPQLHELMKELQLYCNSDNSKIQENDVHVGQCYAGLHSDGHWYRVIIDKIFSSTMIMVSYCDYGDILLVGHDKLKPLPENFTKLPKLAITARLYGIKPKNTDWEMEDCLHFQKLIVDHRFASVVENIIKDELSDGNVIIELTLIDVSTDSADLYINDEFIKEGRALKI